MTGAKPHSIETHLFVSGTVQGVFFRAKTKQHADKLHLKGYVRNLSDGRVEICVMGNQVAPLIEALQGEPPPISIQSIETHTSSLKMNYSGFTIER
ncbi:MAG: acylphosphatase [Chlamydiales bacterium]|nr:acylphosphatase [Chlamydiales bacterium]